LDILNKLRISDLQAIEKVYHTSYYIIADNLMNKGMTEQEVRLYFRKALSLLIYKLNQNNFATDVDVTLYLLVVINLLSKNH